MKQHVSLFSLSVLSKMSSPLDQMNRQVRSLENHSRRSKEESKVEEKIVRKSKGWVILGFNKRFMV